MNLWFRSTVFNLLFYILTVFAATIGATGLLPSSVLKRALRFWSKVILFFFGMICRAHFELKGLDHAPLRGPCIIASKHQSAWDTMIFLSICEDAAYIMKEELFRIPLYGAAARRVGMISVKRDTTALSSLKKTVEASLLALQEGRSVVVFPEGTRVPVHKKVKYQPGVYEIYRRSGLPVRPVVLNSGLCWPRHSWIKFPGTIRLQFLEEIKPGYDKVTFMTILQNRIESAYATLGEKT